MKINDEKKSAIKLINQYAERYTRVDLENKELLSEIDDLKKNLKISKDIIDSFFRAEQKEKSKLYLKKTKEEISLLNATIEKQRQSLKEARDKNTYYEIIMSESIMKYQSSTDDLQKKIFLLENDIKKKDAVICYLNIKLNKLYETLYLGSDDPKNHIKEIYLLEPSMSLMLLHNELEDVKSKNEEISKKLENTVDKLENLKIENEELKNEKNSIISESSRKENTTNTVVDNISIDLKEKNFKNEEWISILKKAKITKEVINSFANTVIGESVEILVKMIMEKNMQLRVVYKENQNLNERNVILFNEVCEHKKTISQMKNEIKKFQCERMLTLNESKFEASLNLEKENLFKHYEKYLDEFNAKTQRLSEIIIQDEIKDCYKSFITNDSTMHRKKNQMDSFISETMRKSDNIFNTTALIVNNNNL